ncbi:MAG: hypothetical protein M1355_00330 [Patescibacteria group bacterium]|nr:hypothetical protein [Patescibacteria group bacterium]
MTKTGTEPQTTKERIEEINQMLLHQGAPPTAHVPLPARKDEEKKNTGKGILRQIRFVFSRCSSCWEGYGGEGCHCHNQRYGLAVASYFCRDYSYYNIPLVPKEKQASAIHGRHKGLVPGGDLFE